MEGGSIKTDLSSLRGKMYKREKDWRGRNCVCVCGGGEKRIHSGRKETNMGEEWMFIEKWQSHQHLL